MTISLLQAIKNRTQRKSELGYGILTADRYVRTVSDCVGNAQCDRLYGDIKNVDDLIKAAAEKLTYSNEDMVTQATASSGDFKEVATVTKDDGSQEVLETPPNTLMVFRHVLTTPRKDRDGDILRTGGARPDPKMALLWQHIHTLPIGKMLSVAEHTDKVLKNISAIIDINELAHDAAVMIDNGMGRFSHGFRAMEWEQLKEEQGETTGGSGFDIKVFEIMEESLVSVPSNVDAETEDILLTLSDRKTLKSEVMRRYVENTVKSRRNLSVAGADVAGQLNLKFAGVEINITEPPAEKADCVCEVKTEADPESKDVADVDTSEKDVADSDVKRLEPGSLEGSWEWTEKALRQAATGFMQNSGVVNDMGNRFVWVAGTFPDNAIVCTEHERSMVQDEFLYFKVAWELKDGIPRFTGEPVPIQVNVTLEEQREASPFTKQKLGEDDVDGEKTGRALSRANMRKLQEVKSDLEELAGMDSLTRAGNALCQRCISKISDVMGSADNETSTAIEASKLTIAASVMRLYACSDDELGSKEVKLALTGLQQLIQQAERRNTYQAITK